MTDAIQHLYDRLKAEGYPNAQLGGIYANKPGYHNTRNNLPGSDYSVQRADDQLGDGGWAAGLDITMHDPADMARLTQRLIDLTHARDGRVQVLREFLGTVDGHTVVGMDVRDVRLITSDPSHLWHEHLSMYRRYAGDHAAMDALADAILGDTQDTTEDDDEPITIPQDEDDDMKLIRIVQDGRIIAVSTYQFDQVPDMDQYNALATIWGPYVDVDIVTADRIHDRVNISITNAAANFAGQFDQLQE